MPHNADNAEIFCGKKLSKYSMIFPLGMVEPDRACDESFQNFPLFVQSLRFKFPNIPNDLYCPMGWTAGVFKPGQACSEMGERAI